MKPKIELKQLGTIWKPKGLKQNMYNSFCVAIIQKKE